jgi:hypothetical protein
MKSSMESGIVCGEGAVVVGFVPMLLQQQESLQLLHMTGLGVEGKSRPGMFSLAERNPTSRPI